VRPADGTTPAGTLPVGARRTGTTAAGARRTGTTAAGARRTGTTAAGARHTGTTPAGACGGEPAPELAEVVARLRRAMRRAARAQHGGLPAGLSVAQLELLGCLAEHPGARPGELARMLRLAPSSVATLIAGLRQAGLISRTGGAANQRPDPGQRSRHAQPRAPGQAGGRPARAGRAGRGSGHAGRRKIARRSPICFARLLRQVQVITR
jgi:DNA-binding CsgD family transcriptional regulator